MFGVLKGLGITIRHVLRRRPVVFQYPDEKRADLAPRFRGELELHAVMGDEPDGPARVKTDKMPPCMATCPSNMKIREYVGLVSMGRLDEAIEVIKEDNPLPLICGRVCPHPCESSCRRGDKDEPVAINPIKRFAADYDLKMQLKGDRKAPKPKLDKSKKVAIIGAGPAGLTCAYYLAKEGYPVTIFEKLPVAGGMLAVGIPDYRLPKDILKAEIDQILNLGVDLKLNTAVDNLDNLFKKGFEAVFVGIGAHRPMKLEIDGEDLEGVIPGEQYLMDVTLGNKTKLGKKVAIIGGGNTAIDCARVSLREGAKEVSIVYRRTQAEMPAHHIEIEDADEEGIKFIYLASPICIKGNKSGRVHGIECQRMELGAKDKSGRRRPVPIEGSEFVLKVDTVMSAISRTPEAEWLDKTDVEIHPRWGTIVTNKTTGETSKPGVFAGGDVSLGADIAIAAIGGGKRAAFSIHAYLSGGDIKKAHIPKPIMALVKPLYGNEVRQEGAKLKPKERVKSYVEVELGLSEEQALVEGKRCLSCESETCIGCNICADNCPADAIHIDVTQNKKNRKIKTWDLKVDRCIFCGICVEVCPTKTLYHTHKYELAESDYDCFDKHKDYLLRGEDPIEKEGWTLPHKHVLTMPMLSADKPRKNKNEGWELNDYPGGEDKEGGE